MLSVWRHKKLFGYYHITKNKILYGNYVDDLLSDCINDENDLPIEKADELYRSSMDERIFYREEVKGC